MPGIRYLFTLQGFLGFFIIYAVRVNLNVAIVSMVNTTVVNNSTDDECKTNYSSVGSSYTQEGEFDWSPELQAAILGSFYYGYCITQIPGGRLAEMYDGKWVFGIGTFISILLTLLSPLAARFNAIALIVLRTIEGLALGVTVPAMHSMIGHWLPDTEKSLLSTIIYNGMSIGTVVTMIVTGQLCESEFLGGWPSAYYLTGIAGCFWFIFWCLLITETPRTNSFITKKELDYITSNQTFKQISKSSSAPWRKIFTSLPFWALIIAQTSNDWSFYTSINDQPTYFSTILHFDVAKNGFLSSYPRILQVIVGILVGYVADYIIRKKTIKTIHIRKFCTVINNFGLALSYIAVCFAGCDVTMNITYFTLGIAIAGFYYSGCNLTHLDLSPEYAGTLMGITNTISSLTGFLAPVMVGVVTQKHQGLYEWRIIYGTTAAILMAGGLFFVFFASAEKQDWGGTDEDKVVVYTDESPVSAHN